MSIFLHLKCMNNNLLKTKYLFSEWSNIYFILLKIILLIVYIIFYIILMQFANESTPLKNINSGVKCNRILLNPQK